MRPRQMQFRSVAKQLLLAKCSMLAKMHCSCAMHLIPLWTGGSHTSVCIFSCVSMQEATKYAPFLYGVYFQKRCIFSLKNTPGFVLSC